MLQLSDYCFRAISKTLWPCTCAAVCLANSFTRQMTFPVLFTTQQKSFSDYPTLLDQRASCCCLATLRWSFYYRQHWFERGRFLPSFDSVTSASSSCSTPTTYLISPDNCSENNQSFPFIVSSFLPKSIHLQSCAYLQF